MQRLLTFFLLCLFTTACLAGEVIDAHVDDEGDHYFLHLEMRIQASHSDVYRVLVDFNNIKHVNDTVKVSRLIESNDKVHLVHMESEGCVWFFCRRVNQEVVVTELGEGYIMSVVQPEKSDLKYGRTLWQVIDAGEYTRIKYDADFVPDFWVPPLFGPMIFKSRLLTEAQKTVNGIETRIHASQE